MPRLKSYSDPSFSGVKGSNIVYPKKGGEIINYGVDGSPIYADESPIQRLDKLGDIKSPVFNPDTLKIDTPSTESGPSGAGLKTLNSLMPYASNLVNGMRKLPQPIMSPTETPITPELVNYDAARNAIDVDQRNLNKETDYRVSNPAVAQALKAASLGQAIQGRNSLAMGEANANADIKNRTKIVNQGILGRNIQRRADFNDKLVGRNIEQQNLLSENVANISDKYQLSERDRNLMSLEERKLSYLPEFYEKGADGTSPYDRFLKRNPNAAKEVQQPNQRYGGRLRRFRNYYKQY